MYHIKTTSKNFGNWLTGTGGDPSNILHTSSDNVSGMDVGFLINEFAAETPVIKNINETMNCTFELYK